MKGVDALIASVLIILISITGIFIALQMGSQSTDRAKEMMLMQEGKGNIMAIDNAVEDVLVEGEGSTRSLSLTVSGGSYSIGADSVLFSMESRAQIVGEGVSKVEDGIQITGLPGSILPNLSYDSVQVSGESEFGRGQRSLIVRNSGFNATSQRQIISIYPAS